MGSISGAALLLATLVQVPASQEPETETQRIQHLAEQEVLKGARQWEKQAAAYGGESTTVDFEAYSLQARQPVLFPKDYQLVPGSRTGWIIACAHDYLGRDFLLEGGEEPARAIALDENQCFQLELEPGLYAVRRRGKEQVWKFVILPGRKLRVRLGEFEETEGHFNDVVVKVDIFGPEGYLGFNTVLLRGERTDDVGILFAEQPFHRALPIDSSDRDELEDFAVEFAMTAATPELGPTRFHKFLGAGEFPTLSALAWEIVKDSSGNEKRVRVQPSQQQMQLLVSFFLRILSGWSIVYYSGVHDPMVIFEHLEKWVEDQGLRSPGFAETIDALDDVADGVDAWLETEGIMSSRNLGALRDMVQASWAQGLFRHNKVELADGRPEDRFRKAAVALSGAYCLSIFPSAFVLLDRVDGRFKIVDFSIRFHR